MDRMIGEEQAWEQARSACGCAGAWVVHRQDKGHLRYLGYLGSSATTYVTSATSCD